MKRWQQISLLSLCVLILLASTPGKPAWRMKADYVEACSCHLFCPCYFNKHAEHPHCEFNMAVKVREGYSGNTNLAGSKYWLTGDLGDEWATNKKGQWVVVSFDPATNKEQRDALAPMILKTYGLDWGEVKVQEAPIEKNVKYFGAQNNEGFEMYRSLDHSANVQGHKFAYSDRNAFLISIDTHEGEGGGMATTK